MVALLRSLAGAGVVVLLVSSGESAQAVSGLRVTVSSFSGSATFGEDLDPQSDTPIFFTEQITWSLPGVVQRRVVVGQTVVVPVRIRVRGSAHGVYAILDRNGKPKSYVSYDCSSSSVGTQRARLRLSRSASGVRRIAVALTRQGSVHAGGARCTDKEQALTFIFPSGSQWLASHLVSRALISRLGEQIDRTTTQPKIVHDCDPGCTERLQFTSRVKLTARP